MCEYCEKKRILRSCNFCGSANLLIVSNMIDVWGDEKRFHIFKRIYRPRFDINYCPMCGKRLGE